ncbi:MAG: cell wall hydrolase [Candidatus Cloacimonetes bacterium]|nr:cell wall hydrolase [Candidatus Cloacimonadota bacterium]
MRVFFIFIFLYSFGFAEDQFVDIHVSGDASSDVSSSIFGQNSTYKPADIFDQSDQENGQVVSYRWVQSDSIKTKDKHSVSLDGSEKLYDAPTLLTSRKPHILKRSGTAKILSKEGSWLKIDLSKLQSVLTIPKFKTAKVATKSSSLALRPNLQTKNKSKYKWLSKGTAAQILDKQGNWLLIKAETNIGFSYSKYIEESGLEEEYWHDDAQSEKSVIAANIAKLQEKIDSNIATIPERFEYVKALESYLSFAKVNELNSMILELKKHIDTLVGIKVGTSKELDVIDLAKKFKESQLKSVTREVNLAKDFLKNGDADKSILYGKIAAYKSDFSDQSSLVILKDALDLKVKEDLTSQEKRALNQERIFINKLIIESKPTSEGNDSNATSSGTESEVTALSEYDKVIDVEVEKVLKDNNRNYLTKGKNTLVALDKKIDGKSAKLKYYLAKQYVYLARVYSSKEASFKSQAKSALEQAKALDNKHVDEYTENNLWAKKAEALLDEGLGKVEDVPVSVTSINSELKNLPGNRVTLSNYDLNALASIAVLESGAKCQQETLDVAQVVFNRINSKYFKNTIDEVVFRYKAFEPFGSVDGSSNKSKRQNIFSSRDLSLKYVADFRKGMDYRLAKQRVEKFIVDLKDVTRMKGARNFVGGRAFFLGSNQSYHPSRGDVTRNRHKCNHYKFGLYNDSEMRTHKRVKDELVREAPVEVTGH